MTTEQATSVVAKGAELLDRVKPGWANQIDVGTLNMGSTTCCVAGQLFDGYYGGMQLLFGANYPNESGPHGFNARHEDLSIFMQARMATLVGEPLTVKNPYSVLQDAWVDAIAQRIAVKEPIPEPVGVMVCA